MTAPIPVFKGLNFEFWKLKLVNFFKTKGLERTLQRPVDTDKSSVRNDAKARMYILESVDDKHVELIMQEATARDMVDVLERTYSVLPASDCANDSAKGIRHRFLALKMGEGDNPRQFFREFKTYLARLDDSGDHVTSREVIDCLQMSVAKSYRRLLEGVNPHLEPLQIVEQVKEKIVAEYAAHSPKAANGFPAESAPRAVNGSATEEKGDKGSPWNAFKAFKGSAMEAPREKGDQGSPWNAFKEAFKGSAVEAPREKGDQGSPWNAFKEPVNGAAIKAPREKGDKGSPWNAFKEAFKDEPKECHRCGQCGHFARECPQPKECYKCGQEGHLRYQCTQGATCFGCGQAGHRKHECPDRAQQFQRRPASAATHRSGSLATLNGSPPSRKRSNEFERAESPMQQRPPALMASPVSPPGVVKGKEPGPEAEWILDSCATHHTVCDESLFSKCVSLEQPITVEVANGSTLTASKKGEVRVCFRVGNQSTVKVLPTVFLIEEFEQNLLSIQRLVQFGGSVVLKSSAVELRDQTNQVIACGKKIDNLYVIKSYLVKSTTDNIFDDHV